MKWRKWSFPLADAAESSALPPDAVLSYPASLLRVAVWAKGCADYLKLETGETIRLDRLVSVANMPLPDRC